MVHTLHTHVASDPLHAAYLGEDPGVAHRLKRVIAVAVAVHAVLFFIRFSTAGSPPPPRPSKPPVPTLIQIPNILPRLEVKEYQSPERAAPVIVPESEDYDPLPVHETRDWYPPSDAQAFLTGFSPFVPGQMPTPRGPLPSNALDVLLPIPLETPEPDYPPQALRMGLAGVVILRVVVDETGHVTKMTVVQGAPLGMTEAAEEAVRNWRYSPAILHGTPVSIYKQIVITFRLKG